ncbi:GNAT family N-acetyltransferase [Bhargavaea ullalensis]|uniref:Diadenosine tetraphosphate (Ap4A) HIT family hydrolase/ribosomal protein S18 acetylase RimI-like enzyme n=1 Tax=Bhargavaea ullalensis TaxID=1265685 RepID=A0ABV2G820_9BACL
MTSCIFCDIIAGWAPAHIVYEDEHVCCFLDKYPINPGHVLVVPKVHVPEFTEVAQDSLSAVIRAAQKIARAIEGQLGTDGVTIMQNNGIFKDVDHYHLHVVPRFKGDGFGWVEPDTDASSIDFPSLEKKLRDAVTEREDLTLRTARCVLAPPVSGDRTHVQALYQNDQVRAYLGGPRSAAEAAQAFEGLQANPGHCWTICHQQTGTFMGLISLDLHHDGEDTEISFQLLPEFWGHGFGAEAAREVIRFAFDELKLQRVIAETQSANTASRRLLERLGMGDLKVVERFGAEQWIYSLDRKEWAR